MSPVYEYRCPECGHEEEMFHSVSQTPDLLCSYCSTGHLERQIGSNIGAKFRGAGFYSTDYNQPTANNKRSKK